jgi:anaerobic selenocysteine-containing dehydrogenase
MPGVRRRVAAFCPLCVSRCGCEAVVEDGRLVAIEPDPSHPTGKALCAKGRASPELVEATDRLLYPMRRTRPKGDPDPGWRRITWDEALNETATAMRRIAAESGPGSGLRRYDDCRNRHFRRGPMGRSADQCFWLAEQL